jgi:Fe-S cluster assembly ATP-binding protein
MLLVKNLFVNVNKKKIVKGLDLTIKSGEIHAIMGPNGSGKSTLAQSLMGHPHYRVKAGTLSINNHNLKGKSPDQRAKLGLFLAFQYPVGIDGVSVQNFLRQADLAINKNTKQNVLQFRKALQVLSKKLGIKQELLSRSLNQDFSGGEKKRIEILQLLTLKPKYAILDETDSGLDIDAIKTVAKGVNYAVKNQKTGVILITHYQRILNYVKPNKVHIMVDGQIVKSAGRSLISQVEKTGYKQWQ